MKRTGRIFLLLATALVAAGCTNTDTEKPDNPGTDAEPANAAVAQQPVVNAEPVDDAKPARLEHTIAGSMARALWTAVIGKSDSQAPPGSEDDPGEPSQFGP